MDVVAATVKALFWSPHYARHPFPSASDLQASAVDLDELTTMNGADRRSVLEICNVVDALKPAFIRAIQHLTTLHSHDTIDPLSVPGGREAVLNFSHRPRPSLRGTSALGSVPPDVFPLLLWRRSAAVWGGVSEACQAPLLGHAYVASSSPIPAPRSSSPSASLSGLSSSSPPAVVKHAGLINQGSTCYLNSLLQTLFHLSSFRLIIYRMRTQDDTFKTSSSTASPQKVYTIPTALQRLFLQMQTSTTAVGTNDLTNSFGWSEHDSFIQHDIHELTRVLLDNLENKLNAAKEDNDDDETNDNSSSSSQLKSKKGNWIQSLFRGTLENYIEVKDCNYCGSRQEDFYDLQLVVKGCSSIYDSLDRLLETEQLCGKNQYCLERDGTKSYHDAIKGMRLLELPPVLFLHLTRFDFDMETGEMAKVLSKWEYLDELNLERYVFTKDGSKPPDATYLLHSVLVHAGVDARRGHYFCYIRDEAGTWYKFNDESVRVAEIQDVLAANFGGSTYNYWGSKVPLSTNAYLLVYIQKSKRDELMKRVNESDIPQHIADQLQRESEEAEVAKKHRAEAHLYGKIQFFFPDDIAEFPTLLSHVAPRLQFPAHRMLRVKLTENALETLALVAKERFMDDESTVDDVSLWFVPPRTAATIKRLSQCVTAEMSVADLCLNVDGHNREAAVLVLDRRKDAACSGSSTAWDVTHHKWYDPHEMKVKYLRSLLVPRSEPIIALSRCIVRAVNEAVGEGGAPAPLEVNTTLTVVREELDGTITAAPQLAASGDIFVWQRLLTTAEEEEVLYPSMTQFHHFLKRRCQVKLCQSLPPSYPVLEETELADDMSYDQLQRYVAKKIHSDKKEYIRFSRHNPDTQLPYFSKPKKKDRPTLRDLLKNTNPNAAGELSKTLYYEVCPFTVEEIESKNSLLFELFDEQVQPLSSHWILTTDPKFFTVHELLRQCVEQVYQDYDQRASEEQPLSPTRPPSRMLELVQSKRLDPTQLRLVDVWRGRFYNIHDFDWPVLHVFEESAEFRLELAPLPIPDVPALDQVLMHCHHFSKAPTTGKLVCHSDPFSLYVSLLDTVEDVRHRIASRLGKEPLQIQDWRLQFVRQQRVQPLVAEQLFGDQLLAFAESLNSTTTTTNGSPAKTGGARKAAERTDLSTLMQNFFHPNVQKESTATAFLGLEHASAPNANRRGGRRGASTEAHSIKIKH